MPAVQPRPSMEFPGFCIGFQEGMEKRNRTPGTKQMQTLFTVNLPKFGNASIKRVFRKIREFL